MPEAASKPKRYNFKAGITQLLDILVHSVYTSKDIFIRELISNSVDALEKIRFLEVQGNDVHSAGATLEIKITTEETDGKKFLTVTDTGIGMTADEIRENIGTIAHSGAASFLKQLEEDKEKDLNLIGRFGIGFYAVFMTAERVTITSRSFAPDAEGVVWESQGKGSYTIHGLAEDVPRGTSIRIELKPDEERFADKATIEAAIQKYSNFVPFPIFVDDEQKNKTKALWREQPSQVSEEDYSEFGKFITHDTEDPLMRVHISTDTPIQFSALMFVPETNRETMGFGQGEVSLQLYVKRVLIDSENKDLLPKYLRFVKGIVESEDLPLNISRETLQENRVMMKIRDVLTNKILTQMEKMATDSPEEYTTFWKRYGPILKEGYSDFQRRERFQELVRFNTSHLEDSDGLTGLADYVERMSEDQKAIYYLTGATREALERDPRLELFRKKQIEVIYLIEAADEFVLASLGLYQEKPLQSADQVKPEDLKEVGDGEAGETDADQSDTRPSDEKLEGVLTLFKETLGDRITDAVLSERLVDSPACLVNEDGMSGHMDRIMRLMHKEADLPKRKLEINPNHALIRHLSELVGSGDESDFIGRACEQVFEGAMLIDGYLTDPHKLVERMQGILTEAASLKVAQEKTTDHE
jgi:molecular chaperone HtpG